VHAISCGYLGSNNKRRMKKERGRGEGACKDYGEGRRNLQGSLGEAVTPDLLEIKQVWEE